MDNPLTLILGGFGCTLVGLLIGYLLGRLNASSPEVARTVPERERAPQPPQPARPPAQQKPQPVAAPSKKWAHPPSRVLEMPSRMVDAMQKEAGALDLNGDGNVAFKVSMMTTNGQTRYTLRNEEEGVTHEFDRLEDIPAEWRPLVDRFLASQREIFGGRQQLPRPPK